MQTTFYKRLFLRLSLYEIACLVNQIWSWQENIKANSTYGVHTEEIALTPKGF